MITLITGVPGSGKTLYAVKLILQLVKLREDARKKLETETDPEKITALKVHDRSIYVDINGFNHDKYGTLETPEDWQTTPDGSAVFYDECQQKFGPDGGGRSKNTVIQAFEVHRHTGHDIYLITQRERLLHPNVRDLIGKHYHIQRQFGSKTVKIFSRDEVISTTSTTALNKCDMVPWQYDKKLFSAYQSATVHTHSFKMPHWLKIKLTALVLLVVFGIYMLFNSLDFWTGATEYDTTTAQVDYSLLPESEPFVVSVSKPNEHLMGCAVWSNESQCQCYTVDGFTADLSYNQCMTHARGSTLSFRPQNIKREKRDSDAQQVEARNL